MKAWGMFLCAVCVPACAHAAVKENLRYSYYDVNAGRGNLYEQILAAVPARPGGGALVGNTVWEIGWEPVMEQTDSQCQFTGINIDLDIDISLPRLVRSSVKQRRAFDRFITALREHELGHAKIATTTAQQLEREVMAIPPGPDCASIEAKADAAWDALWQRATDGEKEYDRITEHGKTQGAWLTE